VSSRNETQPLGQVLDCGKPAATQPTSSDGVSIQADKVCPRKRHKRVLRVQHIVRPTEKGVITMSFLKKLFGESKSPTQGEEKGEIETKRKEDEENPVEQPVAARETLRSEEKRQEEENPVEQLAAARERLRLVEARQERYIFEGQIPLTLIEVEAQLRKQIAGLENECLAHQGVKPIEDALARKEHLTGLLATARENLRLIEGRREKYKSETDVPLESDRAEQRWRDRIAELENELGKE
jgi:hypothetical protein